MPDFALERKFLTESVAVACSVEADREHGTSWLKLTLSSNEPSANAGYAARAKNSEHRDSFCPEIIEQAAAFCKDRGLALVIKATGVFQADDLIPGLMKNARRDGESKSPVFFQCENEFAGILRTTRLDKLLNVNVSPVVAGEVSPATFNSFAQAIGKAISDFHRPEVFSFTSSSSVSRFPSLEAAVHVNSDEHFARINNFSHDGGALSADFLNKIKEVIASAIRTSGKNETFTIDLRAQQFMDDSFIGTLFSLAKIAQGQSSNLKLLIHQDSYPKFRKLNVEKIPGIELVQSKLAA